MDRARSELKSKPDILNTQDFMTQPLIDEDGDDVRLDLSSDPKKRHHWIYSRLPDRGKTQFCL